MVHIAASDIDSENPPHASRSAPLLFRSVHRSRRRDVTGNSERRIAIMCAPPICVSKGEGHGRGSNSSTRREKVN